MIGRLEEMLSKNNRINFVFYGIYDKNYFPHKAVENVKHDIELGLKSGEKTSVACFSDAFIEHFDLGGPNIRGAIPTRNLRSPNKISFYTINTDSEDMYNRILQSFDRVEHSYIRTQIPVCDILENNGYKVIGNAVTYLGFDSATGVSECLEEGWLNQIANALGMNIQEGISTEQLSRVIEDYVRKVDKVPRIGFSQTLRDIIPKIYQMRGLIDSTKLQRGDIIIPKEKEYLPCVTVDDWNAELFSVSKE